MLRRCVDVIYNDRFPPPTETLHSTCVLAYAHAYKSWKGIRRARACAQISSLQSPKSYFITLVFLSASEDRLDAAAPNLLCYTFDSQTHPISINSIEFSKVRFLHLYPRFARCCLARLSKSMNNGFKIIYKSFVYTFPKRARLYLYMYIWRSTFQDLDMTA